MHKLLDGHESTTAQQRGWGGVENGELLRLAESEFDLFITSDQNVRYQQNLSNRRIAILELSTNDLHRINAAATAIQGVVDAIQPVAGKIAGRESSFEFACGFLQMHRGKMSEKRTEPNGQFIGRSLKGLMFNVRSHFCSMKVTRATEQPELPQATKETACSKQE